MKIVFLISACVSIIAVVLICVFLFVNGVPAMAEIGFFDFLLGETWRPSSDIYGIMPMILGSIYVTAGAIIVGVPLGLFTAVFMAYFCPHKLYKVLKPAVDLLAGIPSVVYGFFGLVVMVPLVRSTLGGRGTSMLTASLLLGIMILPTIISVSESSIRAVPRSYYEGSLALGATKERSVFFSVLPAAKSGVLARSGAGHRPRYWRNHGCYNGRGPISAHARSLLEGVRTLTANIVMEMGYAQDLHREALIATAVVLFVFILIINLSLSLLRKRSK